MKEKEEHEFEQKYKYMFSLYNLIDDKEFY